MNNPEKPFTLFEEYYQPVPDAIRGELSCGRICWAPSQYLLETLTTLMVQYVRPGEESDVLLKLVSENENPTLFNHPPILHPPVHTDEEFVAIKAKKRPVVILSRGMPRSTDDTVRAGDFPESFVVAPFYTLGDYDPEFIERVKALEYHQFFHVPASTEFGVRESFVRFDRIHSVARRNLEPERVMLTGDACDMLMDWLRYHLSGELEETIAQYREIRLKAIKPTATKPAP